MPYLNLTSRDAHNPHRFDKSQASELTLDIRNYMYQNSVASQLVF